MANTLNALARKVFARAVLNASGACVLPSLVDSDIANLPQQRGTTVDVPISGSWATQVITPGVTPSTPQDDTPTTVPVTLDQWYEAKPFALTDLEMQQIDANESFIPMKINDAFNAMRELVNADIFADYWRVYNVLGSAGTNPFASTQLAQAANIQLQFDIQKARGPRRVILDGPARTNALSTADFVNADRRGSANSINTGALGTVFGVDYYYDQQVPRHVSTALTAGAATASGANALGAKTVNIAKATNNSPLVKGDIITFSGDTQTYTVTANVTLSTAGAVAVSIEPGLAVAKTGGETVTLTASHRVNLAFTRPAIAFANREAGDVATLRNAGANVISQVDPVTGVVYSLEIKREHFQVAWHLSALWGKRIIKPEWCFRLMGA